jgi:uncharacterized protein
MRALVNIRHLEAGPLELRGRLTLKEMDIDPLDPLVHVRQELAYDLVVQKVERGILAQGNVELALECECSRCLTTYTHPVRLDNWICHLPFEGEERAPLINDLVDLTPYLREDIVLAFPQRPLCEPECKGLSRPLQETPAGGSQAAGTASPAWAELNKLKL